MQETRVAEYLWKLLSHGMGIVSAFTERAEATAYAVSQIRARRLAQYTCGERTIACTKPNGLDHLFVRFLAYVCPATRSCDRLVKLVRPVVFDEEALGVVVLLSRLTPNMADVLKQSDQLFDTYKFRESYELLQKQSDRSYDTLWRLARVIYSLSRELVDDASKSNQLEALIFEGFDYAKRALELQPDRSAANKYYAIFLAEKSGIEGLKERVLQLSTILKYLQRATELDASDPFAWFVLGRFYQKLAGLPWFQKKLIHTFTQDVPDATFEDALQCFERAETVHPNFFPLNHLMLGETYIALKNVAKARHYLQLAANQTAPHTADDLEARKTAQALLRKL